MQRVFYLPLILAIGACAVWNRLDSRLYMDESLATTQQLQTRARYESIAAQMGCTDEAMDAEWKQRRYRLPDLSESPCITLGRFGIPNYISQDTGPAGETVLVMWRRDAMVSLVAVRTANGGWRVTSLRSSNSG